MSIVPIIICGGAGTRLWPVSREAFPKPLLKLADGQSLLQKTYLRACGIPDVEEVVFVTNRDTYFLTKDECTEIRRDGVRMGFVLEPISRNTAAAIEAAALVVRERHGPEAVMLVMPADHLINDLDAFNAAIQKASDAAKAGKVVAFGVKPIRAETGFGYIEYDGDTREEAGACDIVSFVEKPKAEVAEKLASDGRHAWNAGIFCFAAGTMLDEMEALATDVAEPVKHAIPDGNWTSTDDDYVVELARTAFETATDISIDYAVMERTNKAAVVPCDIGWSDIGSWLAISDLTQADDQGNRIEGAALLYETSNCYFRSEDRMIGAVGVEDLVVVDTPDALLIARRDRAQDVKQIVSQLKQSNHDAYRIHRTVHRPWGTYTVLEEGDRFKMKRIVVKPGASLSLQMHHHRSEHWIVVRGCADVVNGERVISLQPNESTYIPAGHKHRLINPGVVDLVLIEVQCGEYLGEDDIVRFEDVYGRAPAT